MVTGCVVVIGLALLVTLVVILRYNESVDYRGNEGVCQCCGGPNPSWSAPSPLWNEVMRGGSIDGPWEGGELVCPGCFIARAEKMGVVKEWRLYSDQVMVDLETVTPSGRVWDDDDWLWKNVKDISRGRV